MPTITEQRQAVATIRQERQDAYEAWQEQCWRRDEITDQAERLAAPMENSFDYTLTPKGLVTDLGEPILPVIQTGVDIARHHAVMDSRWQFEVTRREIELEEQQQIESFARGDIQAEALVVLSPIPDAVRLHGVDIGAYDKHRQKMLARIVTRTEAGVRITSLSLDKSNYQGMQAIAVALGRRMPPERPASEDILRNRMWLDVPVDHADLVNLVRDAYDQSLRQQFGGQWFAGRNAISVKDAVAFIESRPHLLDEHMRQVVRVHRMTQDKQERLRLLAPQRYNYAASLDEELHGAHVTNMAGAGDNARAEGKTFEGDCPVVDGSSAASEQLEALGYQVPLAKEVLKCVNCPFCKKVVDAIKRHTPAEKSIECQSCFAKLDLTTGERMDVRAVSAIKKVGKTAVQKVAKAVRPNRAAADDDIIEVGGIKIKRQERLAIGGTVTEYVNVQTGERTDQNP